MARGHPHGGLTKTQRLALRIELNGKLVAPADLNHGTQNTYDHWGCRCDPCKFANTQAMRRLKNARKAERFLVGGRLVHPNAPHGTANGYSYYVCRCMPCTTANAGQKVPAKYPRR